MPKRKADAVWNGNLTEGHGVVSFGGGAYEGAYSFKSRFEEGKGTNPEEMIAAAHASCYSMALSAALAESGYAPESVSTQAEVSLENKDGDFVISRIELSTQASVPGIAEDDFMEHAEGAKNNCPVSKALGEVEIVLHAQLN